MDAIDHTTREGLRSPNAAFLRCWKVRDKRAVTNCLASELDPLKSNNSLRTDLSVNASV
jgi:hypothetical protein